MNRICLPGALRLMSKSVVFFLLTVVLPAHSANADLITGVSIEDASSWFSSPDRLPERVIDGSGFDEANGFHSTVANNEMWTTFTGDAPDFHITFDLEANYDLGSLKVWNFNEAGFSNAGARAVEISVAGSDGGTFTSLLTTEFVQAPENASVDFGQVVDLSAFSSADNARLVRFDISSNWGFSGGDFVGLSEVRFDGVLTGGAAVPEPSTFALFGVGAVGLIGSRIRKRTRDGSKAKKGVRNR